MERRFVEANLNTPTKKNKIEGFIHVFNHTYAIYVFVYKYIHINYGK